MQTLSEDLLLLALDDEQGTVSWEHATTLRYGLGGALLMDLALLKRIATADKKVVVNDTSTTGDEVLDAALETISTSKTPHDAEHWVKKLGDRKGLEEQLARRLVARGILREQEQTFLWIIHDRHFPTVDPGPEALLRSRIRAVTLSGDEPDTRTLLLLSLVNACNLTDGLFRGAERRQARRRIQDLVNGEQFGKAVGGVIADVVAAVTAISVAVFTTVVAQSSAH